MTGPAKDHVLVQEGPGTLADRGALNIPRHTFLPDLGDPFKCVNLVFVSPDRDPEMCGFPREHYAHQKPIVIRKIGNGMWQITCWAHHHRWDRTAVWHSSAVWAADLHIREHRRRGASLAESWWF